MGDEAAIIEYRCPGETYSISRAVHLARLADFYPACQHCPRRNDTLGLPARKVHRLREVYAKSPDPLGLGIENLDAIAINDLPPPTARAAAIEFSRMLQRSRQAENDRDLSITFGSDGRLATAAHAAAMVEGIRWTGCEAVDLGRVSSPCMAAALGSLSAAGGIYLGNPSGTAHTVGLKFWTSREPISPGAAFAAISAALERDAAPVDRPARTFGALRRFDAAEEYLNELRPAYHALRPLRYVLRSTCGPVETYLEELTRTVACRAIAAEPGRALGEQVAAAGAHFGIEISNDGEHVRVFDEQGAIVDVQDALQRAAGDAPIGDALRTLTFLLVLLSRGDEPLSAVITPKA